MGAVIPTTVSSFQALRAVLELATLAGANAALYIWIYNEKEEVSYRISVYIYEDGRHSI